MPPTPVSPDRARIAVVGAGPRGTSFLERLLAVIEEVREAGTVQSAPVVDIVVLDPHAPGPGRVWRTDQSPLFLMNTPSFFPTAAAAGTPGLRASSVGQTFDQWRMLYPDRAGDLDRTDYPQRAVYGHYLADLYREVTEALEASGAVGTVAREPAQVVCLEPGAEGGITLGLEDGRTLEADAVVLGLGHVPARLNREQQGLQSAATELGLQYRGPNLPAEVDWDAVPAGEDVLVRGMGLNFFDGMAQLTLGRGGRFVETGEGPGSALRYEPSGREPVMHPASRRGVCYLPKAELETFVPHAVSLKYLVPEEVQRLQDDHGTLDFMVHLWPLIHRDVVRAYYFTLARTRPEVLGGPERAGEFLAALVGQLEAAGRGEPVTAHHAQELLHEYQPGMPFLDIRTLARPFEHQVFDSGADYQEEVVGFLTGVCAEAAAGEASALMVAIGTLHAARLLVKQLVAERRITDASRRRDVSGWFEALVEGLASGPPLLRVEQLLALARAGLVRFVGPDPQFEVDSRVGLFSVSSPQVGGGEAAQDVQRGRWMIEAMMPANRVQRSSSPLVASMLKDGIAVPYAVEDEEGEVLPGRGFDVTGRPYRLKDADGRVHERVFVLGLQLASVQWGTAIAAEAGQDPDGRARTLGDADAAARAVWALLTR
ncbi:MAG: FAD/NAD(P)-binding protein [Micrococcus sp.]|nr:FAD/NAD(P)-binding protein [Micrococcus sp.]